MFDWLFCEFVKLLTVNCQNLFYIKSISWFDITYEEKVGQKELARLERIGDYFESKTRMLHYITP